MRKSQKQEWIEEQEELGKKLEEANDYKLAKNERTKKEIKNELSFRTRHNRLSIRHKFNDKLDRTVQEDRDRFSMETIYNKMKNGEPVLPSVIKQGGQYLEEGLPEGDLTQLLVKDQENKAQYGNIDQKLQEVVSNLQNDHEQNEDETKVTPTNVEESKDSNKDD